MTSTALSDSVHPSPRPMRWGYEVMLLAAITAAARIGCICIWPAKTYSVDLYDWNFVGRAMLAGVNPYKKFQLLNWPPAWMGVLFVLGRICVPAGWSLITGIRLFLTFADVILVISTCALLRLLKPDARIFPLLLFGICLNPLLILLTVQQGNFDVLPTIGIVWFLYCLIQFRRQGNPIDWLCAAAWLGLATFAKTFPIALLPLLVAEARRLNWQTRLLGAGLCVGPTLLSLAPLYVLSPEQITKYVIHYRGTPGPMGVSGLLQLLLGYDSVLYYAPYFSAALLISLGVLSVILWRNPLRRDADEVLLATLILIGIFEFGSGFCPQYWMWVAPLLVVCYAIQPTNFRRIVIAAAVIVVVTLVLAFAYDQTLGSFMLRWMPTLFTKHLMDRFSDPLHTLVLICLPMTAITFILWVRGFLLLVGKK